LPGSPKASEARERTRNVPATRIAVFVIKLCPVGPPHFESPTLQYNLPIVPLIHGLVKWETGFFGQNVRNL
jgi:hypothetical protein